MSDKKDYILAEIKRVAKEIGRTPGRGQFEKLTSIKTSEWHGRIWRSWGDALVEAGLKPNTLQKKYEPNDVLKAYAGLVEHLGRVPAEVDVRMWARQHPDFPAHSTFRNHFGNKEGLIAAFKQFVNEQPAYARLIPLLPRMIEEPPEPLTEIGAAKEGLVYLLRSGEHYKIGRSENLERRIKEISVAMPEAVSLEHSIRTGDPQGIEAYWHRRFSKFRANGEWFALGREEVKAFKRRTFQ